MSIESLHLAGHIADLKDSSYKNTLIIAALTELLSEKGLISSCELSCKARELDNASLAEIAARRMAAQRRPEALR